MKNIGYIVVALLLAACGSNSFKTEGGTQVTYLKKGEGEAWKDSTIAYFSFQYLTESGHEMYKTPQPAPMRVGGEWSKGRGELFQVLPMLNVGDSVTFTILASNLFDSTFRAPRPDSIPADSQIEFFMSKTKQQTEDEYYFEAALDQKEVLESYVDSSQLALDRETLNNYYSENNIEVTHTTENGIGIKILEEGNGPKPKLGQTVNVDYSGYVLSGKYFDSSNKEVATEQGLYNPAREPYGPYTFKIYLSQVILGWHEGIVELNEGTKATLYIPSPLGYGPRRRSDVIVENSILVFDVELVGIGD